MSVAVLHCKEVPVTHYENLNFKLTTIFKGTVTNCEVGEVAVVMLKV